MITELITNGPQFVAPYRPDRGGVDFLGMRQVNVDMMAGVFPGINNVTWWVRPFTLVSWLYWKFYHLAAREGTSEPTGDQLQIWRERVEVLFTWGHRLEGWQGLPGISFAPPKEGVVPLSFSDWGRTAINTSLMAAVQYGPAAKTLDGLGFLEPCGGTFFRVCGEGIQLAEALDRCLGPLDTSGLLDTLKPRSAGPEQARKLFKGWSVGTTTQAEKRAFRRAFFAPDAAGQDSAVGRRSTTVQLILDLIRGSNRPLTVAEVRAGIFDRRPVSTSARIGADILSIGWLRWQVLQVRQLQRLALEALLSWFEVRLSFTDDRDTGRISAAALKAIKAKTDVIPDGATVDDLRGAFASASASMDAFRALAQGSSVWSPFQLMESIQKCVREQDDDVVPYALRALFICSRFTELLQPTKAIRRELMLGSSERLSLVFVKDTIDRCGALTLAGFLQYLFENLILSQHFSVAARRFDGQTQRLRVSIEEEGLSFLADKPLAPFVTPDRLATALSLMADCGLLTLDGSGGYATP